SETETSFVVSSTPDDVMTTVPPVSENEKIRSACPETAIIERPTKRRCRATDPWNEFTRASLRSIKTALASHRSDCSEDSAGICNSQNACQLLHTIVFQVDKEGRVPDASSPV